MTTYQVQSMIDGSPTFIEPLGDILATLKPGGALKILSPLEHHTDRQRRWYRGVCLPFLVKKDENKNSEAWWDTEVKKLCDGLNLLKLEYVTLLGGEVAARLTVKGVGKKNMTTFINEILAKSVEKNWGLVAPDSELRT